MASKAKSSSTEFQCQVADDYFQLFGGYGYMEEYPIARAFLDAGFSVSKVVLLN
jgi:acyl-CoA dehydrogenase